MIIYDTNYIRVVDGALSKDYCEHLIDKFNQCSRWSFKRNDFAKLTELNMWTADLASGMNPFNRLTDTHLSVWDYTEDYKKLNSVVVEQTKLYKEDWDSYKQTPTRYMIENYRTKKYEPNSEDEFPIHTDATRADTCQRYLACLFYLNDSDGGTEFVKPLHTVVPAKQGRLVMFPPSWQWVHRGVPCTNKNGKYILSTYLSYIYE